MEKVKDLRALVANIRVRFYAFLPASVIQEVVQEARCIEAISGLGDVKSACRLIQRILYRKAKELGWRRLRRNGKLKWVKPKQANCGEDIYDMQNGLDYSPCICVCFINKGGSVMEKQICLEKVVLNAREGFVQIASDPDIIRVRLFGLALYDEQAQQLYVPGLMICQRRDWFINARTGKRSLATCNGMAKVIASLFLPKKAFSLVGMKKANSIYHKYIILEPEKMEHLNLCSAFSVGEFEDIEEIDQADVVTGGKMPFCKVCGAMLQWV